jgi:hypothetical protein
MKGKKRRRNRVDVVRGYIFKVFEGNEPKVDVEGRLVADSSGQKAWYC